MKEILSILSALFVLFGLIWYSKETKNKNTKPNIVVLGLWIITAGINAITYLIIVQDIFKSLLLIAALIANIIIVTITIRSKNYLFLKRDLWIVGIGITVIACLILFLSVKDTHVIMQILTTIPYIPLIIGIVQGKGKEPFNAWFLIFISTLFGLSAILVEYSDYWSLIHPLRSIILQIAVMICIKKFKR